MIFSPSFHSIRVALPREVSLHIHIVNYFGIVITVNTTISKHFPLHSFNFAFSQTSFFIIRNIPLFLSTPPLILRTNNSNLRHGLHRKKQEEH